MGDDVKSEADKPKIKGRFVKGQSGNPRGRPKKADRGELTADDKAKIAEYIHDGDIKSIAVLLCSKAQTPKEVRDILKEQLPYISPKLQNVRSDVNVDNNITISIAGFESINQVVIDAEPVQELEDQRSLVEAVAKDRIKELKKP